jgi:two-component system, NarL family, sensor kinase
MRVRPGWLLLIIMNLFVNITFGQQDKLFDSLTSLRRQALNMSSIDPSMAEKKFYSALLISSRLHNYSMRADLLAELARFYRLQGNCDSAIKIGKRTLHELKQNIDSVRAKILANIGDCYFSMGQLDSALFFQLASLRIKETHSSNTQIAHSLYSLGNISSELDRVDDAVYYLSKGMSLAKGLFDDALLARFYEAFANLYYNNDKLNLAEQNYQQARHLYEKTGNSGSVGVVLTNLASIKDEKGEFETSTSYYYQAIEVFRKNNQASYEIQALNNLGRAYLNNKKLPDAQRVLEDAESKAVTLKSFSNLSDIWRNLSDVHHSRGNFERSRFYLSKYINTRDSLMDIEKQAYITNLQETFNKEKREKDILLLTEQKKNEQIKLLVAKKRNVYLAVILIVLAIALTVLFIYYRQKAASEKFKHSSLLNDILKQQEIKSITNIMEGQDMERKRIAEDLHDRLGSMLATIKLHFNSLENKIEKLETQSHSQYEKASRLLDDVCQEVRKIAYNMESGVLTNFGLLSALEELVGAIENTSRIRIQLHTHNFTERLPFEMEIQIYRVVQELLSNVIKHAEANEIIIEINRFAGTLTIILSDDGKGYSQETIQKGLGLKNVRSRVEKLKGKITVDSDSKTGTTNIIEIPLT